MGPVFNQVKNMSRQQIKVSTKTPDTQGAKMPAGRPKKKDKDKKINITLCYFEDDKKLFLKLAKKLNKSKSDTFRAALKALANDTI